jgi:hypothetical protein
MMTALLGGDQQIIRDGFTICACPEACVEASTSAMAGHTTKKVMLTGTARESSSSNSSTDVVSRH